MHYFDRMTLQILIIGLLAILSSLLVIFMQTVSKQKVCRVIIVLFLVLPLLFVPIPWTVILPASAPEWLIDLRLASLEPSSLSPDFIDQYFLDSLPDGFVLDKLPSQWLAENDLLRPQTFADHLSIWLPFIRWLYLAGFLIAVFLNLQMLTRKVKKRKSLQHANLSYLQRDQLMDQIALLRDELGIYRKADVIVVGDDDGPGIQLVDWVRHQLPITNASDRTWSGGEQRQELAERLKRLKNPGILLIVIWGLVRCLVWFNPFWPLLRRRIWGKRQSGGKTTGRLRHVLNIFIYTLTVGWFVLAFTWAAWQLPTEMKITVSQLDLAEAPAIEVLADPDVPPSLLNFYGNTIAMNDLAGYEVWSIDMSESLKIEPDQILMPDTFLQMSNEDWSIIISLMFQDDEPGDAQVIDVSDYPLSFYHVLISADGQIRRCDRIMPLQPLDEIDDIQAIPENPDCRFTLLDNGGFLLQFIENTDEMISVAINARTSRQLYLAEFNAENELIWMLDPDQLGQDTNCHLEMYRSATNILSMEQMSLPFALTDENICIIKPNISNIYTLDGFSIDNYKFWNQVCARAYDQQGQLLWNKSLVRPNREVFYESIEQTDCLSISVPGMRYNDFQDEDMLYMTGDFYQLDSEEGTLVNDSLLLVGLNTHDQTSWQKVMNLENSEYIFDIKAENGCLTILLNTIAPQQDIACALVQVDPAGQLIGYSKISDLDGIAYIQDAFPGHVKLWTYPGD